MDDDLLTLLRTSKIFSPLPKRICKKIIPKFERIELEQDEILYHQGDPTDSVEVLLSGKLESILTTANGENKTVGEIEPGETVGEIGALSGEPRVSTVKAIKHSILFKLPHELFVEICHEYPSVLFAVISPIVSRSQRMIEVVSGEKFKKHIAIFPANEYVSLARFSKKLEEIVSDLTSIILLSDYSDSMQEVTIEKIQAIIDDAKSLNKKKIKQKIIYLLKSTESVLAKYSFEKIEMVYIVGKDETPCILTQFVSDNLQKLSEKKLKPELILLHDDIKLPRNTSNWLNLTEFKLHHHIRIDEPNDYERLLRFIRGKAVGVVLSGGGTRGWAHAGAIFALIEAGIPIDAIGGTSVGSIVAASYALTLSPNETLNQFQEVIEASRNSVSWRSLTWPAISLFNANGLTKVLQKLYNYDIEDLWIPYFCVSTNLAKNSEEIHNKGILWEKIRASVSIPGIIPPMLIDGELHFDGGLLNNLPVDVMRKLIGQRGNIIAVELLGNKDVHKYDFPPILSFWQTFLSKIGIKYPYKFPRFIDTFLKSLLAGSSLKAQQNGLLANILITLDLSRFPMLHSNKKLENRIIDLGYETTMQKIKYMHDHKK